MNTYINSFMRGRELLKKLLVGDLAAAVLATFFRNTPTMMFFFSVMTLLMFVSIIYVAMKFCRCPNCGKRIFLGVLAIDTCPRCKHSLTTGKKVKKHRKTR